MGDNIDLANLAKQDGRDFESHKIHSYEYGESQQQMFVKFKSSAHLKVYRYDNVDPATAKEIDDADSKGKTINAVLVNQPAKFPFTKIELAQPEQPATEGGDAD